jgi:hypothetical protein
MAFAIKVNGNTHNVDVDGDTPLLWVLRDVLGLTGTKFGCGMALCGACTVHIDGASTRSCITPIDSVGMAGYRCRKKPGLESIPTPNDSRLLEGLKTLNNRLRRLPTRKSWQCRRRSHLDGSRDFSLWALRAVINGRGDELIEVAKSNLLR